MYKLKSSIVAFIFLSANILVSQIIVDFESFELEKDNFLNGSQAEGSFEEQDIRFTNNYDENYNSWSGWSISSMTDNLTPGYSNQYSAITGTGVDASLNYATSFVLGESKIAHSSSLKIVPQSLFITNGSYPYLSMLNGDAFAKRFGGEDGNDPDYYLLTIKAFNQGKLKLDSVNFYLADFRFDNNDLDYIINEWTEVDLRGLGKCDSLSFMLSSSDNGVFGMNTPAYFCIDNFEYNLSLTHNSNLTEKELHFYPNPAQDVLFFENDFLNNIQISIYNSLGNRVFYQEISNSINLIDISQIESGTYYIRVQDEKTDYSSKFVKIK